MTAGPLVAMKAKAATYNTCGTSCHKAIIECSRNTVSHLIANRAAEHACRHIRECDKPSNNNQYAGPYAPTKWTCRWDQYAQTRQTHKTRLSLATTSAPSKSLQRAPRGLTTNMRMMAPLPNEERGHRPQERRQTLSVDPCSPTNLTQCMDRLKSGAPAAIRQRTLSEWCWHWQNPTWP